MFFKEPFPHNPFCDSMFQQHMLIVTVGTASQTLTGLDRCQELAGNDAGSEEIVTRD